MLGKVLSPIDASRFSVANVCDIIHVALDILLEGMTRCHERVFVPFRSVRSELDEKSGSCS